ncbi:MAG TPA: hypothetical protein VFP21_11260 [Solirubrobacterales bacterium]|nr:hypothetical protein [Solirubrobacterales bacterium]
MQGSDGPVDLDQLRPAYATLMGWYSEALGEAQKIHRPEAGPAEAGDGEPAGVTKSGFALFGPLVRLLVGSHVRSRVEALSSRFSQIEPVLKAKGEDREWAWLSDHRTLLDEMATDLPSLRIPGVFVVIPFAITLLTALGDLPTTTWAIVLGLVLVPFFTAMVSLVQAYRRKRQLLLEGAKTVDKESKEAQAGQEGRNVYRAEGNVFALLGSRRRPELQLDELTITLSFILLAELCFLSPLLLELSDAVVLWAALVLGFALLIVNVIIGSRMPKRLWR